ncbi:unnamed protein product, partial [Meganyctiphanes norvegica]
MGQFSPKINISFSLIIAFFRDICILIIVQNEHYPSIIFHDGEKYFHDGFQRCPFPSIKDAPTKYLSVIIPAYNEEERLPVMLDECIPYLEDRRKSSQGFDYELIIVDDGSRDKTTDVGMQYTKEYGSDRVRVLTLAKNRGKGGAVRMGMLSSRGKLLLFADADGATKFSDFEKVEGSLKELCSGMSDISESLGMSIGSRAHLEKDSVAHRSFFRTILMYGFHAMVWLLAVKEIKDTQCGFKIFTRRTGRIIFNSLHVERWAFDTEVLKIAQILGIPIKEVAVHWTEIEGSKITPVFTWIEMGMDLVLIWLRYFLGAWRISGDINK